jgi:hypothetical protein
LDPIYQAAGTDPPPVIALDLAGITASVVPCADATLRSHGYNCGGNHAVVCPAKFSDKKSCPLPQAAAYDHHDHKIPLTETIFQVLPTERRLTKEEKIDYSKRSEYFVRE